ncbi:hypothetical protein FOZ63_019114 [Perkinsus olseni]|uniref:Uncharacterized protein n=1 Tax=Perkinsus olseni TaxID=32597 RepID=A0A7J6MTQ6_PEROL|nr:hypothetical protein FOZ60_001126 [Perkinsus olseni]KAF4704213.1 hypothetical protein FOZ63_019114 [Perkinsus olseni]
MYHTVQLKCVKIINLFAGQTEPASITKILLSQRVVGLGVQCNKGQKGIHAITIATVKEGVFIYILERDRLWLPAGLWGLLKDPTCTKAICNVYGYLIEKVCQDFRLNDLPESLFDVEKDTVQSAARPLGLRVYWPPEKEFYRFTEQTLDKEHKRYLAVNALVPLLVVARKGKFQLKKSDCRRITSNFTKYDPPRRRCSEADISSEEDDEASSEEDNETSAEEDDEASSEEDNETSSEEDDEASSEEDDETSSEEDDEASSGEDDETSLQEEGNARNVPSEDEDTLPPKKFIRRKKRASLTGSRKRERGTGAERPVKSTKKARSNKSRKQG